ncbi:CPBP family intramembrane glutamic endopeptidase [Sediminibacterium sp.]|uniref:CPBP family intramembrane glutamic endopeptidase n=1 Tax=Sediminibacterium sp. TaxID=1917865 RepID=UPI0025EC3F12|nr:CPBP family intramembrane glutamic endopeptidase [Sediminibacterium sp.]MBW0177201.1 CPBP family intramembrane metalloprotease [Sediminibacterium sp.]
MNQKAQISFPVQFLLLLGLVGIGMVIGSLLMAALGTSLLDVSLLEVPDAMNKPENANISRLLNTMATLIAFLVPSLVFAKIVNRQPLNYLGFNLKMSTRQVGLVILITFAGMILSGALGMLNQDIPLSEEWLKKAKALEQTYKNAMLNMAYMNSISDFILAILVMALAPAIFEEVLFRGAFQKIFIQWTKNAWVGIIITSILFSAIHFSYFGFLPRIALGMILGLIFYYTNNLWLSILQHFLNNAFIVAQLYIVQSQGKSVEKAIDETMPVWWGLVGLALLVLLFKQLYKQSKTVSSSIISSEPITTHE